MSRLYISPLLMSLYEQSCCRSPCPLPKVAKVSINPMLRLITEAMLIPDVDVAFADLCHLSSLFTIDEAIVGLQDGGHGSYISWWDQVKYFAGDSCCNQAWAQTIDGNILLLQLPGHCSN